jgi:hypothetical protein
MLFRGGAEFHRQVECIDSSREQLEGTSWAPLTWVCRESGKQSEHGSSK